MKKIIVTAALLGLTTGCGEFFYTRDVTGQVAGEIGSRIAPIAERIQQKYALRLMNVQCDSTVRSTAGGAGGTIDVECLSTRCSTLKQGDCVQLVCLKEIRWLEPSIV